jgi:hypothetical protein
MPEIGAQTQRHPVHGAARSGALQTRDRKTQRPEFGTTRETPKLLGEAIPQTIALPFLISSD